MFCPKTNRIQASLDGLQNYLGLSDDELQKVVLNLSLIIYVGFNNTIKPRLNRIHFSDFPTRIARWVNLIKQ